MKEHICEMIEISGGHWRLLSVIEIINLSCLVLYVPSWVSLASDLTSVYYVCQVAMDSLDLTHKRLYGMQ